LRKRTRRKTVKHKIIAVLILTAAIAIYVGSGLLPLAERAYEYQSRLYAVRVTDEAVLAELSGENCDGLIKIDRAADGAVVSVESDTAKIGKLKSRIGLRLTDALDSIKSYEIGVHIGTMTGIPAFYGKGFIVPVKMTPRGSPETHIISEFTDAGINQTLHRLVLTAETEISGVAFGFSVPTKTKTEYIIAETLIVGKIPQSYTHVVF